MASTISIQTLMNSIQLPVLTINQHEQSIFKTLSLSLSDYNGMFISERQSALNYRHRFSESGYESDWHVAGDPTLITIQQGAIELVTRLGEKRRFGLGEQFIAADYLHLKTLEDEGIGHKARVLGNTPLLALHIKLSTEPKAWLHKYTTLLTGK
ncbi:hypothetical protein [Agaribacter flavus]|uniref:Uncharacterized protein n=1 Tax=Agaribacter flavus TaxID=1902781 RepID=A0ABV7FNQ8_9ALTE